MRYLHEVHKRNTQLRDILRLHVSYSVQHSVQFSVGLDGKELGANCILIPEA